MAFVIWNISNRALPKTGFSAFIGYDFRPLLWVLQLMLFDVGQTFFATCGRDLGVVDSSTSANCGEGFKGA